MIWLDCGHPGGRWDGCRLCRLQGIGPRVPGDMRFGNVWHGDFRELADYGWEIAEANAGPPPQQLPQLSDVLAEAARGEVYFYQPDQVETVTVGGAVAVAFKQGDVIWAEVPESAFGGPYDFWHDVWETLEESCEIGLEDGYRAARGLLDPVE